MNVTVNFLYVHYRLYSSWGGVRGCLKYDFHFANFLLLFDLNFCFVLICMFVSLHSHFACRYDCILLIDTVSQEGYWTLFICWSVRNDIRFMYLYVSH